MKTVLHFTKKCLQKVLRRWHEYNIVAIYELWIAISKRIQKKRNFILFSSFHPGPAQRMFYQPLEDNSQPWRSLLELSWDLDSRGYCQWWSSSFWLHLPNPVGSSDKINNLAQLGCKPVLPWIDDSPCTPCSRAFARWATNWNFLVYHVPFNAGLDFK